MKFKNKYRTVNLFYIILIFLFVFFIRNTFKSVKSKNIHEASFVPSNMINDNLYSLQNDDLKHSMMYDSYEPRFIAPRYYDTQLYKQPVYTRTYGNDMYYMNHKQKRKQKHKRYIDESSSDSDD